MTGGGDASTANPANAGELIGGLGAIADSYDGFIFDVWGTVYDGASAFPAALEVLDRLLVAGKRIAFLSNSPQLPGVVAERLRGIGVAPECLTTIVTSGGATHAWLAGETAGDAGCVGPVYQTGPDRFPDTLPRGRFPVAKSIEEAGWILNAGPNRPQDQLDDYEACLAAAAARRLLMVCANPDRTVLQAGARLICAGALAARYEELGGPVHAIGKPFPAVFHDTARALGLGEAGQAAGRVLMIGDNLETDILGANRVGFASLLIAGGVHQLTHQRQHGGRGEEAVSMASLHQLCATFGANPDYVVPHLVW